jgi:5-methylcytosine-specific restriction endonuclease McrA
VDQCKTCARCKIPKPLDQYGAGKKWSDGLFPYCRECKRAADRTSHARHKAKRNASMREHYQVNRESYIARSTAYYTENREQRSQQAVAWNQANAERRLEIRKASFRKAWTADPERFREAWRKRHAAIRRGCATHPFTTAQLAAKVEYWGSRCWICSGPWDSIDHVKPLAKQGPHMLANLRPVCTPCNTRKRDRWPFLAA